MKLSERDRDIIACMAFRADLSASAASEELGLPEHIIRRTVQKLIQSEVLSIRAYINPFAIGVQEYQAFIKVNTPGAAARERVLTALSNSPFTTYVSEIGGDYDFCAMFITRTIVDVSTFFSSLSDSTPDIDLNKTVLQCAGLTYFYPKLFSSKTFKLSSLSCNPQDVVSAIDSTDKKIISALLTTQSISNTVLARAAGIPATTLAYRLGTLRDRGILLGLGFDIPAYDDGLTPFALLLVSKSPNSAYDAAVRAVTHRHPAVSYLLKTVGNWDFEIGVRLADPRAITLIKQQIVESLRAYIDDAIIMPVYRQCESKKTPGQIIDFNGGGKVGNA